MMSVLVLGFWIVRWSHSSILWSHCIDFDRYSLVKSLTACVPIIHTNDSICKLFHTVQPTAWIHQFHGRRMRTIRWRSHFWIALYCIQIAWNAHKPNIRLSTISHYFREGYHVQGIYGKLSLMRQSPSPGKLPAGSNGENNIIVVLWLIDWTLDCMCQYQLTTSIKYNASCGSKYAPVDSKQSHLPCRLTILIFPPSIWAVDRSFFNVTLSNDNNRCKSSEIVQFFIQ